MNWVNGNSFNIGLGAGWACVEHNVNSLDYNCILNEDDVIYFDGSYYSHDGTAAVTDFTRRVTITNISAVPILIEKAKQTFNRNTVFLSPDKGGKRRTKIF